MSLRLAMCLASSLVLFACTGEGEGEHEATSTSHAAMHGGHVEPRPEFHEARGTVLWLEQERIYLNHEEMPGFMDAMAMGFEVRDRKLLEGIEPGTTVSFRVVVEQDTFYIDQLFPIETK